MHEEYDQILTRLKEVEDKVEQSNHMLQSIQRRAKLTLLFSSLKWFVIIGLSLGTFYYTKPYLEQLMDTYKQVSNLGSFFGR